MTDDDLERRLCRQFAATLLLAPANVVVAVLTLIRPSDVELLHTPTAVVFEAAVGVARTGVDPIHIEVHAALLRSGHFAGHQGELVKQQMLNASAGVIAYGERLHVVAAQLLSLIFRWRLAAAGQALIDMSRDGSDVDCWLLLKREGARARELYERMQPNAADAKAVSA